MQRSAEEKPVIERNGAASGPFCTAAVSATVSRLTSTVEQPAAARARASGAASRRAIDAMRMAFPPSVAAVGDQVDRVRGEHEHLARRRPGPAVGVDVADVLGAALRAAVGAA